MPAVAGTQVNQLSGTCGVKDIDACERGRRQDLSQAQAVVGGIEAEIEDAADAGGAMRDCQCAQAAQRNRGIDVGRAELGADFELTDLKTESVRARGWSSPWAKKSAKLTCKLN